MAWDHVDHEVTRDVLAGIYYDDDSVADALSFAEQCCQADQHNEFVTDEMYRARCEALEEALAWWNDEGNADKTVDSLRQFWSV